MRRFALLAAALAAGPAFGQDFSAGSRAASWGLLGERPARFEAEVVDVLCRLTGDCAADCGGGARQLGLLRSADGVLVLAMKNSDPVFSGAVADLAPFCGQTIEVDGLLVGEPAATAAPSSISSVASPSHSSSVGPQACHAPAASSHWARVVSL